MLYLLLATAIAAAAVIFLMRPTTGKKRPRRPRRS